MNLSSARVLLTNDDGINAEGLDVLLSVILPLAREVWVIAPEGEQSASSHSLTLRRPLRIREISDKRFAVNGTPTDCVLLALSEVMKLSPPDFILSGINRGGNLGGDITYSGTVAGAMEGAFFGVPSIALSQVYSDGSEVPWKTSAHWLPRILKFLFANEFPEAVFMNVNFPPVKFNNFNINSLFITNGI